MSGRPHHVDVPLRWSDMDAYGHVNNVQFLRLMEDARIAGFRDWFGEDDDLLAGGCIVARNEIDYLAPLTFRYRPVRIDVWVTRIGGAGFDLGYEFRDPEVGSGPGRAPVGCYARAETSLVAYDFAAARPRRLSAAQRAVLAGVQGPPVALRRRSEGA